MKIVALRLFSGMGGVMPIVIIKSSPLLEEAPSLFPLLSL
jgi:hypothetical protein